MAFVFVYVIALVEYGSLLRWWQWAVLGVLVFLDELRQEILVDY